MTLARSPTPNIGGKAWPLRLEKKAKSATAGATTTHTLAVADPNADSDHDGMPDAWEVAYGLQPDEKTDGSQDRDGDGYTNIEQYLNSLLPMRTP